MKVNKTQKPLWWNADVSSAKKNINYWKRKHRTRISPQNKNALSKAESDIEAWKERAMHRHLN